MVWQYLAVRKSTLLLTRKKLGVRMDICKKGNLGIFFVSLILICLLTASVLFLYIPIKTASALTDILNATSIGNGEEMWNSEEGEFNGDVFSDLINKLFGEERDWKSYVKKSEYLDSATQSYIIPASVINEKAGNDLYGLIVKIGGVNWIITSITLTNDDEEDVVMTLYAVDHLISSSYYSELGNRGNSVYSSSLLRKTLLESTEFELFSNNMSGGFADRFLVQPKNIKYQLNQTIRGRDSYTYHMPNEALQTPTGGWAGDMRYNPEDTIKGIRYDAWGDDYIWIPSLTEIGSSNVASTTSLWKITNQQRARSKGSVWLRSGSSDSWGQGCFLTASGTCDFPYLTDGYRIHPAFHLNLTEAKKYTKFKLVEPNDITKEYTGDNLTFADVDNEQKLWYNSEEVDLEYPIGGMKDAATYRIKATIKSELQEKGIKFSGTPDTSAGEDDFTRYFNFTITKKKIGIEEISETEGGLTATVKAGEVYSGDTSENGRAPLFGFTYTSTDGKGYNSDTYPTAIGAYKATVKITNECNYELDKDYDYEFSINAKEVNKPDVGLKELTYNGEEQTFSVSGMSEDAVITVPSGSGMTYLESERKLSVKNAGIYRVTVSLADNGVATQWRGGGTESYEITLTMKKATLRVDFHSDAWSWNSGIEKEIYIEDDRRSESDVLTYSLSYNDIAMDPSRIVADGTNKKRTNITMPRLANGNYTLKVTLNDTGEGKNYSYAGGTQTFSVTEREIEVNDSHITWYYTNYKIENGAEQQVTNSGTVFQVMYNGEKYTFKVKLDSYLQENGVTAEYETNEGTAVNIFTAKVKLTSTQGLLTKTEFEFSWEIVKGKYDLSNVNWNYTDGMYKYGNRYYTVELQNLPTGLSVDPTTGYEDNSQKAVGSYTARVLEFVNGDNNYITPNLNDDSTYIGTFPKTLEWRIDKGTLTLEWGEEVKTDGNGATFKYKSVKGENADKIEGYKYYRYVSGQKGEEVTLDSIEVGEGIERYLVEAVLKESASKNYDATPISQIFVVESNGEEVYIDLTSEKYTYDGKAHGNELKVVNDVDFTISRVTVKYYRESVSEDNLLEGAPKDAGRYVITLELSAEDEGYYYLRKSVIEYEIEKKKIVAQWDTSGKSPILSEVSKEDKEAIEYEYYDGEGNLVEESQLEAGKTYTVKAKIKDEYRSNYEFVGVDGSTLNEGLETDGEEFEMKDYDPNDPNDPNHPDNPNNPNNPDGDKDNDGNGSVDFEKVGEILKQWWQVVASGISIILIIIFLAKTIGYERRRKEAKKENDERYKTFYAVSGTGLFGLAMTGWTALACILMVSAVASFAIMEVAKNRCSKAEKELSYSKEEYNRMMYMRMMGGNAGNMQNGMGAQGFAYAPQQGLGAEEIRGIVSETMTALLPGMQQMLPQQASANDELVQKLIEQNEKLMQKLSEQQPVERVIEKEVSSSNINDERILKVVAQSENNDETIKRMLKTQEDLMRNQDRLMEKILELSTNKPVETQVVEKEVRVEVPVEKVVEKEVVKEVKVEVPVEVEKIVEKEVPIEVEKVVEKIVEIPAAKPAPTAKKPAAPRLTLDEAYEKLPAKQKRFFDTLKEYAMSKDKCKEKKSTYYILLGQSSVNPLVKLTIKKDCTVALFKMEDEYMKDIRRNAGSEGTKVKVKETELIVGDSQALATAKEMIDLREDQIERYNDYLKEQRSMKKR